MARQIQASRLGKRYKRSYKVSKIAAKKARAYKPYDSIKGTNPQHMLVSRGIGFPDRFFTNLVYSDSIVLTPSSGTPTPSFLLRMNSIFDPQQSLGGGQPTYYDQLALIYKQYRVKGCKVTAMFAYQTTTGSGVGPAVCGINCGDSGLPTTDAGTLISAPNTSFDVLMNQGDTKTVVATYSEKNVFPGEDWNTAAGFGSDPATQWYAALFASPQGTDVTVAINCVFTMQFSVECWNLKDIVDA